MFSNIRRHITVGVIQDSWKLGLLGLIALPVLWSLLYSLAFSLGLTGRLAKGWTTEHWQRALMDGFLARTILHSVYVAFAVTCVVAGISLSIAAFGAELRRSRLLLIMLLVQSGTPAVVVASQTMNWFASGGMLSRIAFQCGLVQSPNEFPAIVNDTWSLGTILGISVTLLPLATLYFMNLWEAIGFERYCRLAKQLGCSSYQATLKVVLPMMIQRGSSMLVLIFLLALGSYEIPLLLGRQSPQMCSVALQQRTGQFNLLNRPQAFALATIYFIACSGLLLLYLRQRRRVDGR